jgi:uncharacterized membrane protein YcgQ (UPF0703/DUF1980 family)
VLRTILIVWVIAIAALGGSRESHAATPQPTLIVSMYRVIANPEAYHGRRIVVFGHVRLSQNSILFLNESAMKHKLSLDAIRLDLTASQVADFQSANNAWVLVEGTFSASQSDDILTVAGELSEVTRIMKME